MPNTDRCPFQSLCGLKDLFCHIHIPRLIAFTIYLICLLKSPIKGQNMTKNLTDFTDTCRIVSYRWYQTARYCIADTKKEPWFLYGLLCLLTVLTQAWLKSML